MTVTSRRRDDDTTMFYAEDYNEAMNSLPGYADWGGRREQIEVVKEGSPKGIWIAVTKPAFDDEQEEQDTALFGEALDGFTDFQVGDKLILKRCYTGIFLMIVTVKRS